MEALKLAGSMALAAVLGVLLGGMIAGIGLGWLGLLTGGLP